jgi:hypothetical protein
VVNAIPSQSVDVTPRLYRDPSFQLEPLEVQEHWQTQLDNRDDAAASLLRAWDHPEPVLSLDLG